MSGKESRRVAPPLPQGRDQELSRAGSGNGRFVNAPKHIVDATPLHGRNSAERSVSRRQDPWVVGRWTATGELAARCSATPPVRVSSPEDGHRRRWLLERRPQSPEHTFPQPQSNPDGANRSNPAARIGTGPARCPYSVTRRRCRRPEGHSPEWSRTGRSRSSHRPCRLRPPVPVR